MDFKNWSSPIVGNSHPTRDLLIEKVIFLMASRPLEEITSELVIEESGISKGSMYHHFKDFPELLEFSYVEIFARLAAGQLNALNGVLLGSSTREEFLTGLRSITHGSSDPALVALRLARVTAIANALSSPRMGAMIGVVQESLTHELSKYFEEVQKRGWGNPDLDPMTVSVFVQAYIVGSVVDLLTPSRMDFEAWVYLIDQVLGVVLVGQTEAD